MPRISKTIALVTPNKITFETLIYLSAQVHTSVVTSPTDTCSANVLASKLLAFHQIQVVLVTWNMKRKRIWFTKSCFLQSGKSYCHHTELCDISNKKKSTETETAVCQLSEVVLMISIKLPAPTLNWWVSYVQTILHKFDDFWIRKKQQHLFLPFVVQTSGHTRLGLVLVCQIPIYKMSHTKCYSCFLYWQTAHVSSWTISVIFLWVSKITG